MTKDFEEKKKRGRKPKKNNQDITIAKVPKKRGRKPKNPDNNINNEKKKKKEKNFSIENFDANNNSIKNENIILHLSVHSDEVNKNLPIANNDISEIDNISSSNYANVNYNVQPHSAYTQNMSSLGNMDEISSIGNYNNMTNTNEIIQNSMNNQSSLNNFGDSLSTLPVSNTINTSNNTINTSDNSMDENKNPSTWKVADNQFVKHVDNWNIKNHNNIDYSKFYSDDRFKNIQIDNYIPYDKKVDNLMKQFIDCNKRNIWPSYTPIYCFWCCHPFQNQPCCLPVNFKDGVFEVFGTFCSPECATSYNFHEYPDKDNKWERYNLINLLYRKIGKNQDYKIKMASPRNCLNIFGGPLTINQFRDMNENYNKNYSINYPPLVSIIPQMEETNFDNEKIINKENTVFIPLDEERLASASENLKLKRSKPISDSKNTLETCMNLQFNK